jgi:hypothetical protein
VQAYQDGTTRVTERNGTNPLPPANPVTGGDRWRHRFIRRAQATWMVHRDHTAASHDPGEHHGAGASGEHRSFGHCGQVDATMSRSISKRRWLEIPYHGRSAGQRPVEPRPASLASVVGLCPGHQAGPSRRTCCFLSG